MFMERAGVAYSAHSALVRACRVWDRVTSELNRTRTPEDRRFYMEEDYEKLKCKIVGNKAEVTVGSSPGHKVHVTVLEEPPFGTLEYYDNDAMVNEVMYRIFTDIGLTCTMDAYQGVKCQGVRDDNVRDVFKALALATSMDFRLELCQGLTSLRYGGCIKREFDFYKQKVAPI
ncbi:MAG: hypothetical protein QW734_05515 [Candidatus Bathyarchaeia archaeon]